MNESVAALPADRERPVRDVGATRFLGLDVGQRRIGVAVSDPTGVLATPAGPLQGRQRSKALTVIAARCTEAGIGTIVVGLPYTLDGRIGPQAEQTLKFVAALRRTTAVPVITWDERFSTDRAREILRDQGVPAAAWPNRIDSIAAAVMLQSYLDARRAGAPAGAGEPV